MTTGHYGKYVPKSVYSLMRCAVPAKTFRPTKTIKFGDDDCNVFASQVWLPVHACMNMQLRTGWDNVASRAEVCACVPW